MTINTSFAEHWDTQGYLIIRELFTREQSQQLLRLCTSTLAQWRDNNPETGKPGGDRNATVMRHLNHAGYFRNGPAALVDLMEAIAAPQVLEVCSSILRAAPLFRCTSLFFNPLDTSLDGNWHRDSQFHYPDAAEEKAAITAVNAVGSSVQLQVALVPSDDVELVPGSHLRWDTTAEFEIRRADKGNNSRSNAMPGALRLALNPGDALAFNPYSLHRGRYHVDKLRRTLMLTYTTRAKPRFDYFSNQPWFDEAGYLDGLEVHTKEFFEAFVTEYQPQWQATQGT